MSKVLSNDHALDAKGQRVETGKILRQGWGHSAFPFLDMYQKEGEMEGGGEIMGMGIPEMLLPRDFVLPPVRINYSLTCQAGLAYPIRGELNYSS